MKRCCTVWHKSDVIFSSGWILWDISLFPDFILSKANASWLNLLFGALVWEGQWQKWEFLSGFTTYQLDDQTFVLCVCAAQVAFRHMTKSQTAVLCKRAALARWRMQHFSQIHVNTPSWCCRVTEWQSSFHIQMSLTGTKPLSLARSLFLKHVNWDIFKNLGTFRLVCACV